jgi:hypothetical protein
MKEHAAVILEDASLPIRPSELDITGPRCTSNLWKMVKPATSVRKFANDQKSPPEELTPIASPWPFSMWGVDIVGPLPPWKGGVKFVVVAVDYFTKWVEAEALVHITSQNITRFLWRSVVCRYGLPHAFVQIMGSNSTVKHFENGAMILRSGITSPRQGIHKLTDK